MSSREYELLERKLQYQFRSRAFLENALTHKSYLNEHPSKDRKDNQRLEFLGDAVLQLGVTHLLVDAFPTLREGELTMTRAQVVSEPSLAQIAGDLGLGDWLFLGRGEENTGGRRKPSILADAFEAVIAAVYLDGGFGAAFELVRRLFVPHFSTVRDPGFTDFKTRLQERAQAMRREVKYQVVGEFGPDHDKWFEVLVSVGGREYARAAGRSKKEAEQQAAANALFIMEGEGPPEAE